jgi:hypothetical protein
LDLTPSDVRGRWFFTSSADTSSAGARDRQDCPGIVRVFCDKMAANVPIAMFEIEYEFEFIDARPPTALSLYVNTGTAAVQTTALLIATGGDVFVNWPQSMNNHLHGFTLSSMGTTSQLDAGDLNSSAIINVNKAATGSLPITALSYADNPWVLTQTGGSAGTATMKLAVVNDDGTLTNIWTIANAVVAGAGPFTYTFTVNNVQTALTLTSGQNRLVVRLNVTGASGATTWALAGTTGFVLNISRNGQPSESANERQQSAQPDGAASSTGDCSEGGFNGLFEWLETFPTTNPPWTYAITVYAPAEAEERKEEDRIVQRILAQLAEKRSLALVADEPPSPHTSEIVVNVPPGARRPLTRPRGSA